jgi:hypothetical protein
MTRADAIAELKETFGADSVEEHVLAAEPGRTFVVVTARQAVPGSTQTTQVAFKLPDPITVRPQQFVDPHLILPSGGQPNAVSTHELNGRLWKTWSMRTPWNPERHTLSQLVHTVVKQWDR